MLGRCNICVASSDNVADATERSLPVHRDIDPARMMRPSELRQARLELARFPVRELSVARKYEQNTQARECSGARAPHLTRALEVGPMSDSDLEVGPMSDQRHARGYVWSDRQNASPDPARAR